MIIKKLGKKAIASKWSPLGFLNNRVKRTNWYLNGTLDAENYPTNEWYRSHIERNYDVANIGSSSGVYAFDYSGLDVKAFNWAAQPQSMAYSFKVLKNFYSIIRQKGIIIIPFSPFSGLSVTGKWAESRYTKYCGILAPELIDNYETLIKHHKYPLFYQPKEALKRLIKDVPKKGVRNCNICHTAEEYEADAKRWIAGWMREFSIADLDAPLTKENIIGRAERTAVVQEIVDFCTERDLQPVFVMPPMHGALLSKFSATFRKNYIYSFMETFTAQGVPFYDYLDDPAFTDDRYFSNSYFMSEEGARAFTRAFLTRIGIIKGTEKD